MMKKMPAFCFAILIILSRFVFAEESHDKTLSPYFFVQGDPTVDQLPLKDTRVNVAISAVIADVTVTQVYRNEGARPINARYIFPASTRAAVYGMRMRIGNQLIIAKVKERERAKKEFEQAKRSGKSASLLEQNRPNVFSMSVANIMPGEQIEIELRYTELLVPTESIYEFVFPTVVGPRYSSQKESEAKETDRWVSSPYLRQAVLPKSEFHLTAVVSAGLPIHDLLSPSHRIHSQWDGLTTAKLDLDPSETFQANRDFILRYRLAGERIASGILLFQGKDENFFLYTAQPPLRVETNDIPVREYIFVVDVSGSMHGFPLTVSKELLRDLIGHLRPVDLFNVVLFCGSSQILSERSVPANKENIDRAIAVIDSQSGGGGTELLSALKRAMEIPKVERTSRTIVLVTDGYISAEKEVFDHIRANLDQTNVFAFGIGSAVNRYLIEGVAKAGQGELFVVLDPSEAPEIASKFREYIQSPVLTNIQVNWNGFQSYDVEPDKIPDLFARRPIVLVGKWRGPATGMIQLVGETGGGQFQSVLDINREKRQEWNQALRYLWARSRVARLTDSAGSDSDRASEITSIGLKYNLLTQYTSFIAVRELIVNPEGAAKDVNQPLPLPKGVTDLAVGGSVTSGSEPGLFVLLAVFAAFYALTRIRRFRSAS